MLVGRITLSAVISAEKDNLCPALEAWSRWHLAGFQRLASEAAPTTDSLFHVIDVAFAIYRSTLGPEAGVQADSVRREDSAAGRGLLYLTAVERVQASSGCPDSL